MKKALILSSIFASVGEAVTGLALLLAPALVGRLLLGTELAGVAVVVGRVAGIALLCLTIACWPGASALLGMLTYSAQVKVYLLWLCIRGEWVGPLLRLAVVSHPALAFLLARAWFEMRAEGFSR